MQLWTATHGNALMNCYPNYCTYGLLFKLMHSWTATQTDALMNCYPNYCTYELLFKLMQSWTTTPTDAQMNYYPNWCTNELLPMVMHSRTATQTIALMDCYPNWNTNELLPKLMHKWTTTQTDALMNCYPNWCNYELLPKLMHLNSQEGLKYNKQLILCRISDRIITQRCITSRKYNITPILDLYTFVNIFVFNLLLFKSALDEVNCFMVTGCALYNIGAAFCNDLSPAYLSDVRGPSNGVDHFTLIAWTHFAEIWTDLGV